MTFIAGPYTWTFNSNSLGIMEDAPALEHTNAGANISGDNLGDSIQDSVYRGGNLFVNVVLQEWDLTACQEAFAPWATAGDKGLVGQPGKLFSSWAAPLIGTVVTGTTATPALVNFKKAVIAPGFSVQQLLGTRLRQLPIRFLILPYADASGVNRWYQYVS